MLRPLLIELEAARRLAIGELDGLDAVLERGLVASRHGDLGIHARLQQLSNSLRDRRRGAPSHHPDPERPPASPWSPPDERAVRRALGAARAELADGDPSEAVEAARRVARAARRAGLAVYEAEALLLLSDGLFVGLSLAELSEVTQTLVDRAEALGSPRLRYHVAFYAGHGDPAELERLAGAEEVAPRVARRARALLGVRASTDAVDALVLATARTSWTERRIETLGPAGEYRPAWGLDASLSRVWLPDGRTIALAKKPLLFRILCTLADQGGEATKETLIHRAWAEREYHPMRHDPKLHVSIRALRKAIEDDPSEPSRLLTTDDGYALGGVIRRVRGEA